MERSIGPIPSISGNMHLSRSNYNVNIPTPVMITGFDVGTLANTCNIMLYNGSNSGSGSNQAIATTKVAAQSGASVSFTSPVYCPDGCWLEQIPVLGATNIVIRYV